MRLRQRGDTHINLERGVHFVVSRWDRRGARDAGAGRVGISWRCHPWCLLLVLVLLLLSLCPCPCPYVYLPMLCCVRCRLPFLCFGQSLSRVPTQLSRMRKTSVVQVVSPPSWLSRSSGQIVVTLAASPHCPGVVAVTAAFPGAVGRGGFCCSGFSPPE
jgi:hypothetical protein